MVGFGPEADPLPVDGPEPRLGEYDRGPEDDNGSTKRFITRLVKWLWQIPLVIIKGILSIFGGRIKEYPDDTWKGGGPEGPASYNAPPPAG